MARRLSRSRAARESFWRKTFARFERSGLSIRVFCEQERLSLSTFGWWRRKLLRLDRARAVREARSCPKTNGTSKVAFAAVRVLPELRPAASPVFSNGTSAEVFLASGHRLKVPAGFDPVTLRHLMAVLGG